jgi:hypothetical protein
MQSVPCEPHKSHNLFLSFLLFEIVHMNRVWIFCMMVHNLYNCNILEVFYSKTKYCILINFVNTINIHNQQRVAVSIVMGCDPCDIVGKCLCPVMVFVALPPGRHFNASLSLDSCSQC